MFKRSLTSTDKLVLFSNLSTMLSAGIPLLEAIDFLLEDATGSQRPVLQVLRTDIIEGKKISTILSKFPESFDPVIINLIRAGEQSGTLDQTLISLRETIKKEIEFGNKIKTAIAYPILVVVTFTVIFIIILTFVVPKISEVFVKLKIDLPLPTRILVSLSNLITQSAPLMITGFVLALIVGIFIYRTKRRLFLKVIFSLPLLSQLGKYIDLTRFSRSLALLLESGIPIIEALALTREVVVRKEIANVIAKSQQAVAAGQKLSVGFKQEKGPIPQMMIRLVDVGERSGKLDQSLSQISEYFAEKVSTTLKLITELLEPVLLVIVGLLIGGTMLAIVAPIYQLIGSIKIR